MSREGGSLPASKSKVERLYERHAPIYDVTRRWILPGRECAIDALGVQPGDLVLDFACGTGANIPGLRRAGAGRVVGVDLSDAMLRRARRRFPDVEFRHGDIASTDLGLRAPRILCSWGLSLVDDPAVAVANLERHLVPGGRLVLLDFDRLHGVLAPFQPAFRTWLSLFGVQAPWDRLGPNWTAPFRTWERRAIAQGYALLVWAEKRTGDPGFP